MCWLRWITPEGDGPQHVLRVIYIAHRTRHANRTHYKAIVTLIGCIDVEVCYLNFEPKYD